VNLEDLAELEHDEEEFVPDIIPVDAKISFKASASKFVAVLNRTVTVAATKPTIPGTEFTMLEAVSATSTSLAYLQVTATDSKQSVSIVLDGVKTLMPGRVLVPGKKVLEILKLVPEDDTLLEVVGTQLTIRSGRVQWTVQTPVEENLPPMPDVSGIALHAVSTEEMLQGIDLVSRAVSTSSARTALMQMSVRDGNLTACDAARFHRMRLESLPTSLDLMIPHGAVTELTAALRAHSDLSVFQMGGNDKHLVFKIGQDTIIAQRLLISFPDVDQILLSPAIKNEYSLTVEAKELVDVIKRVRVNSDPDYSAIFLTTTPKGKTPDGNTVWALTIHAKDRDGNSSQETIEASWSSTKPAELCLHHKHLLDLVTYSDQELVTFQIGPDYKKEKTKLLLQDEPFGFTGVMQQMNPSYL